MMDRFGCMLLTAYQKHRQSINETSQWVTFSGTLWDMLFVNDLSSFYRPLPTAMLSLVSTCQKLPVYPTDTYLHCAKCTNGCDGK